MQNEIREFITQDIIRDSGFVLDYDEPIIERSIIDSTEILNIVLFIEDKFDISVDDSEITLSNLGSINQICDFIERKKS